MLEPRTPQHRKTAPVLEREVSIFDSREQPDYNVIHLIIAYFEDYPGADRYPPETWYLRN
jgi:hypothetical protein